MSQDLSITELVIKYLNKEELSRGESERLKIWLSESDNLQQLEAKFRDPEWMAQNLRVMGQVDEIDHWRKFLERLDEQGESLFNKESDTVPLEQLGDYEVHESEGIRSARIHQPSARIAPIWKYTAVAAAVIAVFGVGDWTFLRGRVIVDKVPTEATAQIQDLAPGGNKAVLQLANGSKIVLDSSSNGQLAEQGSVKVMKLAAGQLSYTSGLEKKPAAVAEVLYNTISTPAGGQYQVELPDGSKAWLNASSSLRFPTEFGGTRKVEVRGEAYFEIAKDSRKPFIVESGDRSIAVLGTSFDVNAYSDEPVFAVSLISGAVKVQQGASQETLRPGQQAQVSNGGIRVNDHVNLRQVTAWKDGLFKFSNADIQTVMRQVARWYNVSIVYEGKIPEDRFTGTMDKSLNASDVLKILALSKVHFRIEGQTIVVMPN